MSSPFVFAHPSCGLVGARSGRGPGQAYSSPKSLEWTVEPSASVAGEAGAPPGALERVWQECLLRFGESPGAAAGASPGPAIRVSPEGQELMVTFYSLAEESSWCPQVAKRRRRAAGPCQPAWARLQRSWQF